MQFKIMINDTSPQIRISQTMIIIIIIIIMDEIMK